MVNARQHSYEYMVFNCNSDTINYHLLYWVEETEAQHLYNLTAIRCRPAPNIYLPRTRNKWGPYSLHYAIMVLQPQEGLSIQTADISG